MPSLESNKAFRAPVLLTVFNRPKQTEAVFRTIRAARPPRLYLAADGPRSDRDLPAVDEVRRTVLDGVDWPCEVKTLLRPENLGLQRAMREAITWFFQNEEMGIILEDDCLPGKSFFPYCEELLVRYREDPRVMHIAGNAFLNGPTVSETYRFSIYPLIWGWATWASAWSEYPVNLGDVEKEYARVEQVFSSSSERRYWKRVLRLVLDGRIESWSVAWCIAIWRRKALAVVPSRSLVRNIGFTSDAVHTKVWKDYRGWRNRGICEVDQIEHPARVTNDESFDRMVFDSHHRKPLLGFRLWMALKILMGGWKARFRRSRGMVSQGQ